MDASVDSVRILAGVALGLGVSAYFLIQHIDSWGNKKIESTVFSAKIINKYGVTNKMKSYCKKRDMFFAREIGMTGNKLKGWYILDDHFKVFIDRDLRLVELFHDNDPSASYKAYNYVSNYKFSELEEMFNEIEKLKADMVLKRLMESI